MRNVFYEAPLHGVVCKFTCRTRNCTRELGTFIETTGEGLPHCVSGKGMTEGEGGSCETEMERYMGQR
jgi:hypothetical protein